jgi:predicted GNAT family N-acyltransferase
VLRREVLRTPLGLDFSPEELAREANEFHFAGYAGDELVACLVLVPLGNGVAKMRQVAVIPAAQGMGIGRMMVEFTEAFAREHRFSRITLHARATVVPFYEKLGYQRVGKEFEEVTIPHWEMEKEL